VYERPGEGNKHEHTVGRGQRGKNGGENEGEGGGERGGEIEG